MRVPRNQCLLGSVGVIDAYHALVTAMGARAPEYPPAAQKRRRGSAKTIKRRLQRRNGHKRNGK